MTNWQGSMDTYVANVVLTLSTSMQHSTVVHVEEKLHDVPGLMLGRGESKVWGHSTGTNVVEH